VVGVKDDVECSEKKRNEGVVEKMMKRKELRKEKSKMMKC